KFVISYRTDISINYRYGTYRAIPSIPTHGKRKRTTSPHSFSPRREKARAGRKNRSRATDRDQESSVGSQGSPFSLFFFSLFFILPQLIPPEIGRRRSKSTVTARQWRAMVEIDRYRPISSGNRAETVSISGTTIAGGLRIG
ncbi:hypothetical protein GW17_00052982, partial [Ensete ventricosum]